MSAERLEDENEDEFEIEIEDDTPEEDRGRSKASDDEPEDDEIEDEELKNYSAGAAKRIKTLTRQKHEQRRRADEKDRMLNEALSLVQKQRAQLQGAASSVVGANKEKLESELVDLKKQVAAAVETGDGEKVADLQDKIADTRSKLNNTLHAERQIKEQTENNPGGGGGDAGQDDPNDRSKWPKTRKVWADANKDWFHQDEEMTGYVYGLHQKLIKNGVVPDSEEYYQKIDKKMKTVFADYFEGRTDEDEDDDEEEEDTPRRPQRAESRAAPINGSNSGGGGGKGGKKIYKITAREKAIADRLGISPKQYLEEKHALGKK